MLKGIKAMAARLRASRRSRATNRKDEDKTKAKQTEDSEARLSPSQIPSLLAVLVTEDTRVETRGSLIETSAPLAADVAQAGGDDALNSDALINDGDTMEAGDKPRMAVISEEGVDVKADTSEGAGGLVVDETEDHRHSPASAVPNSDVPNLQEPPDSAMRPSISDNDTQSAEAAEQHAAPSKAKSDTNSPASSSLSEGSSFGRAVSAHSNVDDGHSLIPSRPRRPASPGLHEVIAEERPPVLQSALHTPPTSSKRPPIGTSRFYPISIPASDVPPLHQPHMRDGTWLVPVSVLTPELYSFEYQFGGLLGEGGFGKVLLALHLGTHTQHAVKVIALQRVRSRREAASIANEVKILWKVWRKGRDEAPFLARPAAVKEWVWQYRGNMHIVMEYYQGGDLGRGANRHPELNDPRRFKLMVSEVVIALLVLHDMGIIHHDVKPTNILVDAAGHCILTDYGGSRSLSGAGIPYPASENHAPIFTVRYAAPEVLLDGPVGEGYGTAADFWSLGVTLFELATGRDLIDEPDDDEAVFAIQRDEIDREQLILLSAYPGLRQFVSALLVVNPAQRLQGYDVKAHKYFADFTQSEWTAIFMKQRPPFHPNKQHPVNPRNTSYDVVARPGENLLDDANEDIVCRWLAADGVGLPHHRASVYHQHHRDKARVGLPQRAKKRAEEAWERLEEPSGPTSV